MVTWYGMIRKFIAECQMECLKSSSAFFHVTSWRHIDKLLGLKNMNSSFSKSLLFLQDQAMPAKDTAQKMKFSIKDFFSKYNQILNGKLHFLCRGNIASGQSEKRIPNILKNSSSKIFRQFIKEYSLENSILRRMSKF